MTDDSLTLSRTGVQNFTHELQIVRDVGAGRV